MTQRLAHAGADIICVPAAWVFGSLKEEHWTVLLQARAIENTVYVLAADQPPPSGVGKSMIIDPMGVTHAVAGEEPELLFGKVSLSRIKRVRMKNNTLQVSKKFCKFT